MPEDSLDAAIRQLVTEEVERQLAERQEPHNGRTPWLTAAEAADYLRWPVKRIYNLTSSGAIPHRKHEGRVLSTATN